MTIFGLLRVREATRGFPSLQKTFWSKIVMSCFQLKTRSDCFWPPGGHLTAKEAWYSFPSTQKSLWGPHPSSSALKKRQKRKRACPRLVWWWWAQTMVRGGNFASPVHLAPRAFAPCHPRFATVTGHGPDAKSQHFVQIAASIYEDSREINVCCVTGEYYSLQMQSFVWSFFYSLSKTSEPNILGEPFTSWWYGCQKVVDKVVKYICFALSWDPVGSVQHQIPCSFGFPFSLQSLMLHPPPKLLKDWGWGLVLLPKKHLMQCDEPQWEGELSRKPQMQTEAV